MKLKSLIPAVALLLASAAAQAGAPPTIMFLPDKTWCAKEGFVTKSERNGKTRTSENYDEAFTNNSDLKNVVTQLNALLKDNGIPPKTYTEASEIDDEEEAEEELFDGAESGEELQMTAYEQALQKLRPDIIIKLGWDDNKVGFNRTVSYRLEAIDSYSGKSIAAITAETPTVKTTVPLAACIKNAATEHMSNFIGKLQEHFDDIQQNGREITVRVRLLPSAGATMASEYGGKELSTIIHEWLDDNTVNHTFSERGTTRTTASYEQVRIPLKDSNGRVFQARQFVDQLKRHIASATGLRAENTTKGLGSGRLYIGEK